MGSIQAIGLLGLVLALAQNVGATEFTVGGSSGWAVPSSDNAEVYNQWAHRMRFQIGDSLLFAYESSSDSLLRVTKDDFSKCNTASPLGKYADGHTIFSFTQSGPYYFISGNKDNCQKNEKMVVVVLADRTKKSPVPAPTPSPAPTTTTTDQSSPPSPPPEAPSTPAPTQEDTHNGASSSVSTSRLLIGAVALLAAAI